MDVKITVEKMKLAMSCSSYNELAERLNISLGAIDSWKNRKNIPNRYLMQVCDATGVSLDWLTNEDKPTFTITGGINPISQVHGGNVTNYNPVKEDILRYYDKYKMLEMIAKTQKKEEYYQNALDDLAKALLG